MNKQQQLEIAQKLREAVVGSGSALRPSSLPSVQRQEIIIPSSVGGTRVLVYKPDNALSALLPVYVNMHGGGFIFGNAEMDDVWCRVMADRAGCAVINVDYSLAPEHKFPTAVHECYEVVKWIHEHPEQFSINPEKIAVGGHSAGGNLAAALCLLNRQLGNELSIVYQIIDYAPLDLGRVRTERWFSDHWTLRRYPAHVRFGGAEGIDASVRLRRSGRLSLHRGTQPSRQQT